MAVIVHVCSLTTNALPVLGAPRCLFCNVSIILLTRCQFKQGSRILLTDKDLNGTLRVAVEGMATEEQCKMLIKLAEVCSLF